MPGENVVSSSKFLLDYTMSLQSAVMLSPFMAPDDQGDLLIHVILWPVLGGLLLLVLLIIVLYFVS